MMLSSSSCDLQEAPAGSESDADAMRRVKSSPSPPSATRASCSTSPQLAPARPSPEASSSSPAVSTPLRHSATATDATSSLKKKKKSRLTSNPVSALHALGPCTSGARAPDAKPAAKGASQVVDLWEFGAAHGITRPSRSSLNGGKDGLRHGREWEPASKILEFLYLGSVRDAQNPEFLSKHHIRYIINVSQEEYWSMDNKVQIMTFKVDDTSSADIASLFLPTRDIINKVRAKYYHPTGGSSPSGRKKSVRPAVLVHCQKGRSRSATIVIAYLMYMNGWSVAEALSYVLKRRSCVEPNIGFMEELRKFQESLSNEDRTRRYGELGFFIRNLAPTTTAEAVQTLCETHMGPVRSVVLRTNSSPAGEGGDTSAGTPSSALCFVFFAAKEDILFALKNAHCNRVLQSLQPVEGKELKYACGPVLKKAMLAHQGMTRSFVSDMNNFSFEDGTPVGATPEKREEAKTSPSPV